MARFLHLYSYSCIRRRRGFVNAITGKARQADEDGGVVQTTRTTDMSTKQQFATGFLAMIIVASVAFMPVNAGVRSTTVPTARHSGMIGAPVTTAELAQDQVRDLTYN
jgi:hypothetical protein